MAGRARLLLLVLAATLQAGCSEELTELVVVVYAEHDVPETLDQVRIETINFGDAEAAADGGIGGVAEAQLATQDDLPRFVALRRQGGPVGPFEVRVTGLRQGTPITRRRAIVNFVPGERRALLVRLLDECTLAIDEECAAIVGTEECGETGCTCGIEGTCVDAVVPQERLPLWNGNPVALEDILNDAGADGGMADGSGLDMQGDDAGADMGPVDMGPVDMGPMDMRPMDIGPPDMGPIDMGPPDTGPPCTTTTDCRRCSCDTSCCELSCASGADCEPLCRRGTSCEVDATSASNVEVECDAATCAVNARFASNVIVECTDATCDVSCRNTSNCTVECDDSACLVDCRGASNCEIDPCEGGTVTRCPGNRLVCGRPCP